MEEFLQLHNIYKSFVGVQALRGVDFSIFPGEIHCLVGENGSGKSTLIKIISGVHQPDSGTIIIEGTKVDHIGSINTIARGIQVIYQDLSLFPNLSVAENIAISEIEEEGRSLIDWREVKRIARAAMQRIGVEFDLDELVGELPIGRQQLVAICRALTKEVRLLITNIWTQISAPPPDKSILINLHINQTTPFYFLYTTTPPLSIRLQPSRKIVITSCSGHK